MGNLWRQLPWFERRAGMGVEWRQNMRRTVLHVILNSHLDPAWLWSRAQGEDAAIATARTTCDLLDAYLQILATRGEEYPVSGFCRLEGPGGRSLSAVSADVFACDAQPGGALRLTLLRTPFYAHHDPGAPARDCPEPVIDLGERRFDIALLADAGEDAVRRERYRQTQPLRFSETTLGM